MPKIKSNFTTQVIKVPRKVENLTQFQFTSLCTYPLNLHSTPAPLPNPPCHTLLSAIPPPLPTVKPQPALLRLKSDDTPLGKEKHISLCRFDALSALIGDFKVAVDDDLHLVVGVGVDERGAGVEAKEAG